MVHRLIEHFDRVYINELSRNTPLAQRILALFPEHKIEFVSDDPFAGDQGAMTAQQYSRSKKNLYLTPFQGQFFKRCPGFSQKKALTCCNYYVLNLGLQCNMDCSYCYLQAYLNSPILTIYTNIDQALSELHQTAQLNSNSPLRIGTGEVVDSLSLDPLTLYSHQLIAFFNQNPNWSLELKTKSSAVDQFLDCDHKGNVVVSWSVNPQNIIDSEEHGTASLAERLDAAKKCLKKDFPVAFHFDPLIYHPHWQKNYKSLIQEITKRFRPNQVNNITVGTLRYSPQQRHLMRERFGMNSYVTSAEVFPSESGKLRYDSQIRTQMFQFVVNQFKEDNIHWNISLCMETPETWLATYEKLPSQIEGLKSFYKARPLNQNSSPLEK
jgi:spore photoproduct lyase